MGWGEFYPGFLGDFFNFAKPLRHAEDRNLYCLKFQCGVCRISFRYIILRTYSERWSVLAMVIDLGRHCH